LRGRSIVNGEITYASLREKHVRRSLAEILSQLNRSFDIYNPKEGVSGSCFFAELYPREATERACEILREAGWRFVAHRELLYKTMIILSMRKDAPEGGDKG
jgi:hypothetical protein